MLHKNKTAKRKLWKYAAALPVLAALVFTCTKTTFSHGVEKSSNARVVEFKGNAIGFAPMKLVPNDYQKTMRMQNAAFLYSVVPDSVLVTDPKTGELVKRALDADTVPVSINGKPITGNEAYYFIADRNYTLPVYNATMDFETYIFTQMKDELQKLDNGYYRINLEHLVVDEEGKLAYYRQLGVDLVSSPGANNTGVSHKQQVALQQQLVNAIDNAGTFTPAMKNGKPLNVRYRADKYDVIVKDHKATLVQRAGC